MLMFGGWLVQQARRTDWVGCLAAQAARDPRFPKAGDVDAVRHHLEKSGAGPDEYQMLEDAEHEYLRDGQ